MSLLNKSSLALLVETPLTFGELSSKLSSSALQEAVLRDGDGRYRGQISRGQLAQLLQDSTVSLDEEVVLPGNGAPSHIDFGPLLYQDSTPLDIRLLAASQSFRILPCVDRFGRLVDLLDRTTALRRGLHDNPVVVMAGGFGIRMRPLTEQLPKPMIPLGGGRLIDRVLDHLIACGFHRFHIAVHYHKEQLMNYLGDGSQRGVSFEYIVEDSPQGTAGSLRQFAGHTGLPLIVTNGDVVTDQHFTSVLKQHQSQQAKVTLVCKEEGVDISYGVVECDAAGQLTQIQEKPRLSYLINAGMYVVETDVLRKLPARSYFMTDLIHDLHQQGERVSVFRTEAYWRDVGTIEGYAQIIQDLSSGQVRNYPAWSKPAQAAEKSA